MDQQEAMEENLTEDDMIIEESPGYTARTEYSKPILIMESMRNCSNKRSKEMVKGYWNTKVTKDGMPIRNWVPDARKEFISSVISLKSQLNPEISLGKPKNYRENYKMFFDNLKIKEKKLFDKYCYEKESLVLVNNRYVWRKTGEKIMPDIDEAIIIPDSRNHLIGKQAVGYWNSKVNIYYNELLKLYDEAYEKLNCLISDLDYFKPKLNWG